MGEAMKGLLKGLQMPYSDFWVAYLDAHRKPATRGVHYLATATGIVGTALAIWLELIWLMAGGIVLGVVLAVGSHHLIEHNRPLIRVNPFYGALSDLRMCWLAMTGRLAGEYARLGLGRPAPKDLVTEASPRDTAARPA
jgi:hypothetical protein